MTIQQKADAWIKCPNMTEELLQELRSMDDAERNDSFYRDLAFGTGGLRGILGAGTNRMNLFTVIRATRGLGSYLKKQSEHPSCAVSCDSRIHSRDLRRLPRLRSRKWGSGHTFIRHWNRRRCSLLRYGICMLPPVS